MSHGVEDLQMLRLIKAFQKITDRDARRLVVSFVERLEKQHAEDRRKPRRTPTNLHGDRKGTWRLQRFGNCKANRLATLEYLALSATLSFRTFQLFSRCSRQWACSSG